MSRKKLLLTGAALGLASLMAPAQAQSSQDLQQALAQAQAAAAQAQAAARQAQAALEQALAAAEKAQMASSSASANAVAVQTNSGQGLTVSSGANSATLYGLIDITLFSRNHDDHTGNKVFSPEVAWFSGNRWGLTGSHSTGGPDDLKAITTEFDKVAGPLRTFVEP